MERKQEFMPIKEVKEKRRNLEKKFLRYQEAEHVYSIPVSYTHLDVYKRQCRISRLIFM